MYTDDEIIEVGDEVIVNYPVLNLNTRGVVLDVRDIPETQYISFHRYCVYVNDDKYGHISYFRKVTKTGNHYPCVVELFEKLKWRLNEE